jgi:hypothetical protein
MNALLDLMHEIEIDDIETALKILFLRRTTNGITLGQDSGL